MKKNLMIAVLLDYYGPILTKTQFDMVDLYYNEDLSLAEIAEHFQISRQGVRDSIKRGEAILLDMEEKLGFIDKIREYKIILEQSKACADAVIHSSSAIYHGELVSQVSAMVKDIQRLEELERGGG